LGIEPRDKAATFEWSEASRFYGNMASKAHKTDHSGPKKGRGAYWGRKKNAKKESNKVRRRAARSEIILLHEL
jgi:hypothetical protein